MSTIITEETILRAKDLDARFNLAPDSRRFTCRFIEPGLINYKDQRKPGIELLRKETIDACIGTALGNPVTDGHVWVTSENRMSVEQGIIDEVYYDANDGWYYVKGSADTPKAQEGMRTKRPSCGYAVISYSPGGMYHGIKYDREITGIRFNHLAIVPKPRYEEAFFRLNSIVNPTNMNLFKLFKKLVTRENGADGKPTETTQVESCEVGGDTEVEIDGKMVRLNELADTFKKANTPPPAKVGVEDEIEIDGKKVTVGALVEAYRTNSAAPAPKPEVKPAPAAQPTAEEVERNNNAFQALAAAGQKVLDQGTGLATSSGSLEDKLKRARDLGY